MRKRAIKYFEMLARKGKLIEVITLCGSTRFRNEFEEYNKALTLEGYLIFTCGCWMQEPGQDKGLEEISIGKKRLLDKVHKKKIKISDAIFVINKDGYIGESTASEIEYAEKLGKEIMFMEATR